MNSRRYVALGLLAWVAGLTMVGQARAQYSYQEEEEHRRYEERRREDEARRREYYERNGRTGSVVGLEEERNRRVLALQLQLQHGQIGRRQFDEQVAEIDRELHDRLGQ